MPLTALQSLLQHFRETAKTEREKGTYFEELTLQYLRHEPAFAALYSDVWLYADWAEQETMAVFLVEQCDLQDHATATLEMMGQTGTVEYGLGRCAQHLSGMTPEEIKDMVLAKLEQQEQKR